MNLDTMQAILDLSTDGNGENAYPGLRHEIAFTYQHIIDIHASFDWIPADIERVDPITGLMYEDIH